MSSFLNSAPMLMTIIYPCFHGKSDLFDKIKMTRNLLSTGPSNSLLTLTHLKRSYSLLIVLENPFLPSIDIANSKEIDSLRLLGLTCSANIK